jgi:hypothetical protein
MHLKRQQIPAAEDKKDRPLEVPLGPKQYAILLRCHTPYSWKSRDPT